MELMYPIVIFLSLGISIFIIVALKNSKKENYSKGKKVANTKYVKETAYYNEKLKKYKIILNAVKILYIACVFVMAVLVSRPVTIVTKSEDKFSRDIILSIDVSGSEDEVNLELVKKFKSMVGKIEGDRIGIVIFNTAPVVYCPLTTDYEFLYSCLDDLVDGLQTSIRNKNGVSDISTTSQKLFYGGVIANNESKGSSLIGDGLAGTVFSFPDLKTDTERTRIIVFATDNSYAGKNNSEVVTLKDAALLCKKYKINLYAYCPTDSMNVYVTKDTLADYKASVASAGGKFYTGDLGTMTQNIVDEIKSTKQTAINTTKKTIITDHPEIFFIVFLIAYIALLVLEQRIKLW